MPRKQAGTRLSESVRRIAISNTLTKRFRGQSNDDSVRASRNDITSGSVPLTLAVLTVGFVIDRRCNGSAY